MSGSGGFSDIYSQYSYAGKKILDQSISPGYSPLENKYDVGYYHINIETGNTDTYINAFTDIVFTALESIDTIAFELYDDLSVDSIYLNSNQQYN